MPPASGGERELGIVRQVLRGVLARLVLHAVAATQALVQKAVKLRVNPHAILGGAVGDAGHEAPDGRIGGVQVQAPIELRVDLTPQLAQVLDLAREGTAPLAGALGAHRDVAQAWHQLLVGGFEGTRHFLGVHAAAHRRILHAELQVARDARQSYLHRTCVARGEGEPCESAIKAALDAAGDRAEGDGLWRRFPDLHTWQELVFGPWLPDKLVVSVLEQDLGALPQVEKRVGKGPTGSALQGPHGAGSAQNCCQRRQEQERGRPHRPTTARQHWHPGPQARQRLRHGVAKRRKTLGS
mmetsp:Transcript_129527/g.360870  ORF Transcript_129527/g.360870 Transcript_129527/m.360870 type:complete len:297 (+) Transcript_129527:338-1228(+)